MSITDVWVGLNLRDFPRHSRGKNRPYGSVAQSDALQRFRDAANSPIRFTRFDSPVNLSISLTIALPTTAASAKHHTSRTCSALEIPNPTATGKSLTDLTRLTRASASRVILSRSPLTPAREMA